jgi:hypothetical protein
VNGWNWRASFGARSARLRRPKIICSPSYVVFRSRANTRRGLDFEHMIREFVIAKLYFQIREQKHYSNLANN